MKEFRLTGTIVFICFIALLSIQKVYGQNIELLIDPVNAFQGESLFSLSLINQSNYSGKVKLLASLKTNKGSRLMEQQLMVDVLPNEIKSIRGSSFIPQTNFTDEEFISLFRLGSGLPPMNYVLCIKAIYLGDQTNRVEECTEYLASDFINLFPLYPSDDAELFESRPIFTWMDAGLLPAYTYDLTVVELEKGQTPNAAIRRNMPLISMNGIQTNQLFYPSDASPLTNGKEYAWNVVLNYSGEKVASSETWSFTYHESDSLVEIPKDLSYIDLKRTKSGSELFAVGDFKFKYSTNKPTTLNIKLIEQPNSKEEPRVLLEKSIKLGQGLNKYSLDLTKQIYLKHLTKYKLMVSDVGKNKTYLIDIKYVNPDYVK